MASPRKVNLALLPEIVRTSNCWAQVNRKIGLSNYPSAQKWVKRLGLDTSHFLGKKARGNGAKHDGLVFVEDSPYPKIAKRRAHVRLPQTCTECGNAGVWNGRPLKLQIDHRNGDKNDCRWENLRKVCPNCHSQTDTWGNKKRKINLAASDGLEPSLTVSETAVLPFKLDDKAI